MRDFKPISVPMVAIVSAGVFGGIAVLCVPGLSFLFQLFHLTTNDGAPAVTGSGSSDMWMTMAVLAPLFCALLGLILGTFMASMFNLFAREVVRPQPASEEVHRVRVASISDRPKPKIFLYAPDVPGEPATVRAHSRRARRSPAEF